MANKIKQIKKVVSQQTNKIQNIRKKIRERKKENILLICDES